MRRPFLSTGTGKPWQWCEHPDPHGLAGHCIGTAGAPTGGRWLCDFHARAAHVQEALL